MIPGDRTSSQLPGLSFTTTHMSAVEVHYDAQAGHHRSRGEALAVRNAGALIAYKKFANAVKRRMISEYSPGAALLVDIGCGRGGDISKWRDAKVQHVVAMDLSDAQLREAKTREMRDRASSTVIDWVHGSMMSPDLKALLRSAAPRAPSQADAVAAMFALQYAFGCAENASQVVAASAAMLSEGGVFFGVAPDANTILHFLETDATGGGASNARQYATVKQGSCEASSSHAAADASDVCRSMKSEVHLKPPVFPFSLLVRLLSGRHASGGSADEFGSELLFSLEDTVRANLSPDSSPSPSLDALASVSRGPRV